MFFSKLQKLHFFVLPTQQELCDIRTWVVKTQLSSIACVRITLFTVLKLEKKVDCSQNDNWDFLWAEY